MVSGAACPALAGTPSWCHGFCQRENKLITITSLHRITSAKTRATATRRQQHIPPTVSMHKMKTSILTVLFITLTSSLIKSQTDCQNAIKKAIEDFNNSEYSFHSEEVLPVENTYFYVLEKFYNIKWYLTDSLNYYDCYDSMMSKLLKGKYGNQFLEHARELADSLDNTENWIAYAKFPGGDSELVKFIMTRLTLDSIYFADIKTKIFVQFDIDTTGKVVNPIVRRGINKEIDDKVISIINQLPDWTPGFLYGKPIRQTYTIPINIDFK